MTSHSQLIDLNWRDDYDGLYSALETQRRSEAFVNPASRIALAILELYRNHGSLTPKDIIDYVHAELVPTGGWTTFGNYRRFNRTEYESLVWPVVAALKNEHPGQALIYVTA